MNKYTHDEILKFAHTLAKNGAQVYIGDDPSVCLCSSYWVKLDWVMRSVDELKISTVMNGSLTATETIVVDLLKDAKVIE